jgi:hypothetical protein
LEISQRKYGEVHIGREAMEMKIGGVRKKGKRCHKWKYERVYLHKGISKKKNVVT